VRRVSNRQPVLMALALAVAGGLLPGGRLRAQELTPIDHIAAVVGRVAIPVSRVEEALNVRRQRGDTIPSDPAGVARFRRGIGTRLLRFVEAELAAAGFDRAVLWVLEDDRVAQAFYLANGWRSGDRSKELLKDRPRVVRLWHKTLA